MKLSGKASVTLVIEGSNLREILWKTQYGDKSPMECGEEQRDKFMDWFSDMYSPGDTEEGDEDRLRIDIKSIENLGGFIYYFNPASCRISLWIEFEKDGVCLKINMMNKKEAECWRGNQECAVDLDIDLARIGSELQSKIDSAVQILKG